MRALPTQPLQDAVHRRHEGARGPALIRKEAGGAGSTRRGRGRPPRGLDAAAADPPHLPPSLPASRARKQGAIVITDPAQPTYPADSVAQLSDWYHIKAGTLLKEYLTPASQGTGGRRRRMPAGRRTATLPPPRATGRQHRGRQVGADRLPPARPSTRRPAGIRPSPPQSPSRCPPSSTPTAKATAAQTGSRASMPSSPRGGAPAPSPRPRCMAGPGWNPAHRGPAALPAGSALGRPAVSQHPSAPPPSHPPLPPRPERSGSSTPLASPSSPSGAARLRAARVQLQQPGGRLAGPRSAPHPSFTHAPAASAGRAAAASCPALCHLIPARPTPDVGTAASTGTAWWSRPSTASPSSPPCPSAPSPSTPGSASACWSAPTTRTRAARPPGSAPT